MKRRNYTPKPRTKYGFRKGYMKAAFSEMAVGEIRTFSFDEVNIHSIRTRAGELNKAAGRPVFSTNWDKFTNSVRIKRIGP